MAGGPIGVAHEYTAVVHFQGGTRVHTAIEGLIGVSWERKLDDYSEASIVVAKQGTSRACGGLLGQVTPWAHELSIYRDGALVWQGPITQKTETRDALQFSARDVIAWLDRRVIDLTFSNPDDAPDDPEHNTYVGETGIMLQQIINKTFPEGDPYNNPGITPYARVDRTPGIYAKSKQIWRGSQTVGDLVRDLIKVGVDMFTLGRKLYMVPDSYRLNRAPYRLTDDHFLGDVEMVENGLDTATEGMVAATPEMTDVEGGQSTTNPAPYVAKYPQGHHGGAGDPSAPAWWSRITKFSTTQQSADPNDPGGQPDMRALMGLAQAIRAYGFPTPRSIKIPNQAQLSPEAPLSVGQLVPGRPVRVELTRFYTPIAQAFRINEVAVSWGQTNVSSGASGGGGGAGNAEQIQLSLDAMRQPPVSDEEEGAS